MGETVIEVNTGGGGVTTKDAVALLPSALTVIVVVPAAMPFARPVLSTVATPLELEKTKLIPDITFPF